MASPNPGTRKERKVDAMQELRGEVRQLLSNALSIARALEGLDENKELLNNIGGRAIAYRKILSLMDKGE